jgi:hypothetical protein
MRITLFIFSFQRTVGGWARGTRGVCLCRSRLTWAVGSIYAGSCPMTCICLSGPAAHNGARLPSSHIKNSLCLQVLGHNADPRSRMFSAIWMAAPAVASIAWTVLEAARWACLVRCCVLCCGDEGEERACCALLQGGLLALNRLVVAGQFTPAPSILHPCCLLHGACALPCPPPCRQPPAALPGSSCLTR